MITLLKSYIANPTGKDNIVRSRAVMKLAGLSTDEKPLIKFKDIEIENGSSFVEIDTSKIYKYDEENNEWIEQVKGNNKDIIIENNALLTYINEVTGGDDNNLSDAVATLADGYGKYSIDDMALNRIPQGNVIVNTNRIGNNAFSGNPFLTSISGPNVTAIDGNAFVSCSKLKSIDFPKLTSVGGYAFQTAPLQGTLYLPALKEIGIAGFNRTSITGLNLKSMISLQGQNIFRDCASLKTVYLASTTSILGNVFLNDTNITDIYLPNAESTYTGAPWGATNATIHYNTQFDENGEPVIE